jgi:hypothetical protein
MVTLPRAQESWGRLSPKREIGVSRYVGGTLNVGGKFIRRAESAVDVGRETHRFATREEAFPFLIRIKLRFRRAHD